MKPNLLTADPFLVVNSLTLLSRNSIPFPRNRIPHPNHFLSIVTHPNSSKPSRLLPICSSTNPTRRKQSNPVNEESLNSNVEALGGDELEKNFNVQVANPIVPSFIQSWTKLSLSDQAFFLLSFIAFTTSIAFVSLVAAAVPTLYAMGRAATSLSKLADTAREELPPHLRLKKKRYSFSALEWLGAVEDLSHVRSCPPPGHRFLALPRRSPASVRRLLPPPVSNLPDYPSLLLGTWENWDVRSRCCL